ncbi:MAG: hypothetical protein KCHDKBKB_00600 [Elusimicrobia bacterium]|nr:hypothetical protein [Elusimicrobiota bacterium]
MSVNTVRTKLLTALNDMQSIKAAFDWETSNPDGKYPFATLTLREGDAIFQSTAHNLRKEGFRIRIYQERSKMGQGPESAEDISANVIDELQAHLDRNTTLSGTVKYVRPIGWRASYIDRELDSRILEVDIDAYEIVNSL